MHLTESEKTFWCQAYFRKKLQFNTGFYLIHFVEELIFTMYFNVSNILTNLVSSIKIFWFWNNLIWFLVLKNNYYLLKNTMRKNLPKTFDQLIFCKYTLNVLKFTKYLVNVHKFTKYLVNSYHQRGVKHYVLTNWYQMTLI